MNNAFQLPNSDSRHRSHVAFWLSKLALLLGSFVYVGAPHMSSGQEQAAPRKKKPTINFRTPEREYQTVKKGKWSFEVEKQLIDEAPVIVTKAIKRLEENVDEVFRLIPKAAQPRLKELKFFVMYGSKARGGGHDNGLEYCAQDAPNSRPNVDERWSSCIVVHCAENYSKLSNLWALKSLIHEVGHAHHLENWSSNQAEIKAAWQNAVDSGLYVNVKDDKSKIIPEAYAHTNHLEYFAELTAIYFARCNYAPFNRTELKKYDPRGYAMIQKMWGLAKDDPAPPATKRADAGKDSEEREGAGIWRFPHVAKVSKLPRITPCRIIPFVGFNNSEKRIAGQMRMMRS